MLGFSMEKLLKVVGALSIAFGVLVGGISFIIIDRETFNDTKDIAETLPDNEVAQMEYQSAKALHDVEVDSALTTLFGGVLGGILFLGIGMILGSLRSYEQSNREIRDEINQIKRNQASS
ncbi:hypothetical protein [Pseudalkalibacillus sp. NRS-1564]|uniref:hypothetical protein n=1 Tax=Pseudalkalibacillus sp. NRS-1564 TaxID=3233900 RepID=UPI003D27F395